LSTRAADRSSAANCWACPRRRRPRDQVLTSSQMPAAGLLLDCSRPGWRPESCSSRSGTRPAAPASTPWSRVRCGRASMSAVAGAGSLNEFPGEAADRSRSLARARPRDWSAARLLPRQTARRSGCCRRSSRGTKVNGKSFVLVTARSFGGHCAGARARIQIR